MDNERRSYEVRAPVGKGGFGTVYEARLLGEGGFSKRVALKVLRTDLQGAAEVAQRLRDEARILGLIRHRAVVHVDGLVLLDGRWTVVMEFIDGLDLNKIMKNHGRLPPSVALAVIGELAGALHVAYHTDGPDGRPLRLLHRDIKPGNVTITTAGEVKVLDFGVARADFDLREAETRSVRFGSMGYMAPERLEGEDSAAGDIYALGVLLWEMINGVRFGQTQLVRSRQEAKVEEKLAKQLQLVPNEAVAQLVREMVSFAPDGRPDGRVVERRCGEILRTVAGPLLRDWAEHEIPKMQHSVTPPEDEEGMSGSILVEGSSTQEQVNPFVPPPPPRNTVRSAVLGMLGLSVISLVLCGGGSVVLVFGVLLGKLSG